MLDEIYTKLFEKGIKSNKIYYRGNLVRLEYFVGIHKYKICDKDGIIILFIDIEGLDNSFMINDSNIDNIFDYMVVKDMLGQKDGIDSELQTFLDYIFKNNLYTSEDLNKKMPIKIREDFEYGVDLPF